MARKREKVGNGHPRKCAQVCDEHAASPLCRSYVHQMKKPHKNSISYQVTAGTSDDIYYKKDVGMPDDNGVMECHACLCI